MEVERSVNPSAPAASTPHVGRSHKKDPTARSGPRIMMAIVQDALMQADTLSRRTIIFVNIAHAFDHFVLLIYPTAVIAIAPERGLDYGDADRPLDRRVRRFRPVLAADGLDRRAGRTAQPAGGLFCRLRALLPGLGDGRNVDRARRHGCSCWACSRRSIIRSARPCSSPTPAGSDAIWAGTGCGAIWARLRLGGHGLARGDARLAAGIRRARPRLPGGRDCLSGPRPWGRA